MSPHWWHVAFAWGAAALVLGALVAEAALRQRAARRALVALEGRAP